LQELASLPEIKTLNDLGLDSQILPQVQMKLPEVIQIRLSLNEHENISNFSEIVLPSILLIDENDNPVFCFRCDKEKFIHNLKTKNMMQRLENYTTEVYNNDRLQPVEKPKANKNSLKLLKSNTGSEKKEKSVKNLME